jgi:hypothetical protein
MYGVYVNCLMEGYLARHLPRNNSVFTALIESFDIFLADEAARAMFHVGKSFIYSSIV